MSEKKYRDVMVDITVSESGSNEGVIHQFIMQWDVDLSVEEILSRLASMMKGVFGNDIQDVGGIE